MILNRFKKIIIGLGVSLIIVGTSIGIYQYTRPFNLYQRAAKTTEKENKLHIKNKLLSSGGLEELTSQSIEYIIDKNSKSIEVKKNLLGKEETSELVIDGDKLYLKYGDKYVNILDSNYMKELTESLKIKDNDFHDEYQSELINSINKKDIKKEKCTKTINDKDIELTMLTFTVDKEKAQQIIGKYIQETFEINSEKLIDETIAAQVDLAKASNLQFTDEELAQVKETMTTSLKTALDEKLNNIEYSDLTIMVGVDSFERIRYKEENYDLILNGVGNSIKNITEYLEFGNKVKTIKIDDSNIVSMEDYLENKKETQKEELKNFALENPDEELSLANVSQEKSKISTMINANENKTNQEDSSN